MNIFKFEMKQQRNAIIAWSASLSIILLFFISLYPMFKDGADKFKDLLANYPQWMLDALNLDIDKMSSFNGYYPFALTYTAIIGTICAAYFGMNVLSRENRAKTADFLHSKPTTRGSVAAWKYLAVLCSLVIINVVFVVTSIFWALIFTSELSVGTLVLMSMTMFFMQLAFAAFGAFIAVFFRRIKSVLAVALALGFGFFALDLFDKTLNDAADKIAGSSGHSVLQYISPTKYFDYNAIIDKSGYNAAPFVTLAVVLVIFVAASVIWYRRQDIHAI